VNSQEKLIIVEEIFHDISKKMLETSYILNLGLLFKIALELKKVSLVEAKTRKISKSK
jgi:hypothetical protein